MQSKRILIISPFEAWPLTQGTIVRTHHWVKGLSKIHQLWFAHRDSEAPSPRLSVSFIKTSPARFSQLFSLRDLFKLRRTIKANNIEQIIVSHLWSGLTGVLLKWLTNRPLLIDTHNVEFLRFKRSKHFAWPFVALFELIIYHSANQVVCVSAQDCILLKKWLKIGTHKLSIAENGAEVKRLYEYPVDIQAHFMKLGIQSNKKIVLFFGTATYRPNNLAIRKIITDIAPALLPHPDLVVVIVGKGGHTFRNTFSEKILDNVTFVDYVDDIVATIKVATCIIAPLTAGSGTRFKIIESAACGQTIISTTIGAEGLDRNLFAESLTVEDDPSLFVDAIVSHCQQPKSWRPSPAFISKYDWDEILAKLEI